MAPELDPGQVFAGCRVEAVAGRGGMGVVYRARQVAGGRTVALKLIAPDMAADEAFRQRLQHESRLLASIEHPNVIAFYEAGEADGQLFLCMRFVEGLDLRSLIAGEGRLAADRAGRIVAQVASGLDAAHAAGLVHRDVKPANVLIESREGSERVYLSDFGLTKEVDLTSAITRGSGWVGTLDYVAPEQIQGRRVDARADVYALGAVLFEALTGRVAYVRDSAAAKLYAHLHDPAPSARELRPELPVEVDRVIARAMAKDPARRYRSAGDLGRAAIAAAGGEAITEPEHSVATGAAAPAASRRPGRGVLAAVAGGLLAIAAVGTLALVNTDHRRARRGSLPGAPPPSVEHIDLGSRFVPGDITANFGGAYLLDRRGGQVVKIDRSGVVEGGVNVGNSPSAVALSGQDPLRDRLWVASANDATITEVDASRGTRLGHALRVQPDPAHIGVLSQDALAIVSNGKRPSILLVDQKTRRPIGRALPIENIRLGFDPSRVRVPVGSGFVQVKHLPRDVKATFAQVRNTPLDAEVTDVPRPRSFAMTFGAPPRIEILSPNRAVQTLLLKSPFVGVPGDMTIDKATNVGWVPIAGTGVDGKDVSQVLRIDMPSGKQLGKPIKVGRGPPSLVIDEGVVWVPAVKDQTVTRIDQKSGRTIGRPIDVGPNSGHVAASGGVVWLTGEKDLIRITPR